MIGSYSLSEIAERCKGQIFGDNVEVSCSTLSPKI